MDFEKLVKERRSCRDFDTTKKVDKKLIDKIIEAGLYSPTGMNKQETVIIAITNKEKRDELANLNASVGNFKSDPFYGAPVVLLVISKKSPLSVYNGGAMIENMLLQATELGLGSCWIHRAKEELESKKIKDIINIKELNLDEYEGIGHVILGYPNKSFKPNKKEIKEKRFFYID